MATLPADIVKRAVDTALADVEKNAPQEFQQLQADPAQKAALIKAAREAAEEQVKIAEEFRIQASENVAERLSKHLPKDRVELIQAGLQLETYQLVVSKRADGHHWVDITRQGKAFMESKKLDAEAAIDASRWIQIASIIVEAVLLVISAVGIKVAINERAITKTAKEIIPVIQKSSQLQAAVQALRGAVQRGSKVEIAKAIFRLIKDSYADDILWTTIKSLCSQMSTWQWIQTAAVVTAMIIAAIATDGLALIAKIVLALNSAYQFTKKCLNLAELDLLKMDLQSTSVK